MISSWFERLRNVLSTRISSRFTAISDAYKARTAAATRRKIAPKDTAYSLGLSLEGLNLDAARRQAAWGKDYARGPQHTKHLKDLQQPISHGREITQTGKPIPLRSGTGDFNFIHCGGATRICGMRSKAANLLKTSGNESCPLGPKPIPHHTSHRMNTLGRT